MASLGVGVGVQTQNWVHGLYWALGLGVVVVGVLRVIAFVQARQGQIGFANRFLKETTLLLLSRFLPAHRLESAWEEWSLARKIAKSKRELAEDIAIPDPREAQPVVLMRGRVPPGWGDYVPETLPVYNSAHNFTHAQVAIRVPAPTEEEQEKARAMLEQGKAGVPRRAAGLEVVHADGGLFLRCWLHSEGRWSIECPSYYDEQNRAPLSPPGKFPADMWHTVSLHRGTTTSTVHIDREVVAQGLPQWPPQVNLRLRITSGHVRPEAWFGRPDAWLDPRDWRD